jgi:hypothetical protein
VSLSWGALNPALPFSNQKNGIRATPTSWSTAPSSTQLMQLGSGEWVITLEGLALKLPAVSKQSCIFPYKTFQKKKEK